MVEGEAGAHGHARGSSEPTSLLGGGRRRDLGGSWALIALIVVLAGIFLAFNAPILTARFGPSHEGHNASVWASGTRAMREDGLVDSRFGGVTAETAYANHPPGILAQTYVAESIAGEHRIVTRSPAWIGSIISIALLAWLLLEAGFRRGAVAASVTLVATTQLFLVYGSMLDTPVTSLPFSLAVLIVAQRVVQNRPPPAWALVLVSLLAVCSGWQSTTVLGFAGIWVIAGGLGQRARLIAGAWMASGAALGLTVTLLWIRWVYGGLDRLFENQDTRASGVGTIESLARQQEFLVDLVPYVGPIGLIGLVVALTNHSRARSLTLVTLGAVVVYAGYFRQGAYLHDYWNYAILIPLAVALAALAEVVAPTLEKVSVVRHEVVGALLVGIVALLSVVTPSRAGSYRNTSTRAASLFDAADANASATGPKMGRITAPGSADVPWIRYETGRPSLDLSRDAGHISVRPEHADVPILLWLGSVDPELEDQLLEVAIAHEGAWAIVRAGDVSRLYAPPSD